MTISFNIFIWQNKKLTTLNWPQKSLWIFSWSTKSKGVELSLPCGGQPRFSIASALHQPQWLKFSSPCPHPTGTQVPTAPGSHPFVHEFSLPLAAPLPFAPLTVLDGSGPSTTTVKWTIIAINLKGKSDSLAYKELHMPSSCLSFSWGLEFMVDSPHYWPYAGSLDGSFWVTWRRTQKAGGLGRPGLGANWPSLLEEEPLQTHPAWLEALAVLELKVTET